MLILLQADTASPCIELEIDRLGVFVVTFTPKKETFEVTTQGCLYNAHLSKYISIRVPKKAAEKNFQCAIQVLTVNTIIYMYEIFKIRQEFRYIPDYLCSVLKERKHSEYWVGYSV
jgi:hypothetical protein